MAGTREHAAVRDQGRRARYGGQHVRVRDWLRTDEWRVGERGDEKQGGGKLPAHERRRRREPDRLWHSRQPRGVQRQRRELQCEQLAPLSLYTARVSGM